MSEVRRRRPVAAKAEQSEQDSTHHVDPIDSESEELAEERSPADDASGPRDSVRYHVIRSIVLVIVFFALHWGLGALRRFLAGDSAPSLSEEQLRAKICPPGIEDCNATLDAKAVAALMERLRRK
eukprot:c11477_g1_i1.p3 GENE.c11477_g1_i1~~c11477_g1_i1.p3  ORF type:complete len:125 (-),score=16.44 c11477_g1_i1:403-777(-)